MRDVPPRRTIRTGRPPSRAYRDMRDRVLRAIDAEATARRAREESERPDETHGDPQDWAEEVSGDA